MASLKDAEQLTKRLQERTAALHDSLTSDGVDFGELVELADEIGASADKLAATFAEMDEVLARTLGGRDGEGGKGEEGLTEALSPRRATEAARQAPERRSDEEPTKEELLERAKELDLAGRSEMSKDDLKKAVDKEDSVTKAELLERAKRAGIAGRSEMSKEELRRALNETA
jgi:hypothetical protein